jgi:ribosome-associated protein
VADTSVGQPARTSSVSERSLELALAAARTAEDNRGRNIVVLDMRRLTPIFDYFVIVNGTSRRQLHAISEEIDNKLEDDLGDRRMGIEGYTDSRWILLDYGSVVVHLFDDETRAYYDLEGLWAEADHVDLTGVLRGDQVRGEGGESG